MTSTSEDLKSIQTLDNSALGPFPHHLPDSRPRWLLPEKGNTEFSRTSSTENLDQQSLPQRRLDISPSDRLGGPLLEEGWPWNFHSSALHFTESSGPSTQERHESSRVGSQTMVATNTIEPMSGMTTYEATGSLYFTPPLCYQDIENIPPRSTEGFDHAMNEISQSEYQKEHSNPGGLECRWDGCGYSGTFSRESSLIRHIKNTHFHPARFKCPQCGKTFNRKDTLAMHIRTMHHESC